MALSYSGITSDIVPPGAGRKLERVREQAGLTHLAKERLTAFLCQLSVGGEFSATAAESFVNAPEERPFLLILPVVFLEQHLDVLLILRRISRLGHHQRTMVLLRFAERGTTVTYWRGYWRLLH